MKNKLVLFINDLGLGGAERVVSRILSYGTSSQLELWSLSGNKFYKIPEAVEHKNFCIKNKLVSLFKCFRELLTLSSESVVQCHLNKTIMLAGISKLMGARFCFQTVHCFAYSSFYKRKGVLGNVHRHLFSMLLKRSEFHVFKAKQMVKDFELTFGWRPVNYKIVYNPFDTEKIIQQSLVTYSGELPSKNNVAIVGRLSESKRPFDVLSVAKTLFENYHFHFIGDGPLFGVIEQHIIENDITNVTLHGQLDNPFSLVKQCDAYLSCSESEGFPNALVEAIISGTVCVHSNCATGPNEILHDSIVNIDTGEMVQGTRGILFNVADILGCIKALKYACENKNLLSTSMKYSCEHFIQTVNQELIIEKYIRIINGDYS